RRAARHRDTDRNRRVRRLESPPEKRGSCPTKPHCAEAQDRTGDTWFFRSYSERYANSRLNTLATTHGYGRQQIVQQEDGEQASPSFTVSPENPSEAMG